MTSKAFLASIFIAIALFFASCASATSVPNTVLPPAGVPAAPDKYLLVVSAEEFTQQAHISKSVAVSTGGSFTIVLDSNSTTGFQWNEQANIKDANILKQMNHQYIAPATKESDKPAAGMAGIEEWVFKADQKGSTLVNFSYGRPWVGGEKDVRTVDLTVVVK